jgi:hypothetical protein
MGRAVVRFVAYEDARATFENNEVRSDSARLRQTIEGVLLLQDHAHYHADPDIDAARFAARMLGGDIEESIPDQDDHVDIGITY